MKGLYKTMQVAKFYVPLNTKYVISETFFAANLSVTARVRNYLGVSIPLSRLLVTLNRLFQKRLSSGRLMQ